MAEPKDLLGLYLNLARSSDIRNRSYVRDKFLVLAGVCASEIGLEQVAHHCRQKILDHNPGHLLRYYSSFEEAIQTERFDSYLNQLLRMYPLEKAEYMLDCLGIDPQKERRSYFSDLDYAAALLEVTPEELNRQASAVSVAVEKEREASESAIFGDTHSSPLPSYHEEAIDGGLPFTASSGDTLDAILDETLEETLREHPGDPSEDVMDIVNQLISGDKNRAWSSDMLPPGAFAENASSEEETIQDMRGEETTSHLPTDPAYWDRTRQEKGHIELPGSGEKKLDTDRILNELPSMEQDEESDSEWNIDGFDRQTHHSTPFDELDENIDLGEDIRTPSSISISMAEDTSEPTPRPTVEPVDEVVTPKPSIEEQEVAPKEPAKSQQTAKKKTPLQPKPASPAVDQDQVICEPTLAEKLAGKSLHDLPQDTPEYASSVVVSTNFPDDFFGSISTVDQGSVILHESILSIGSTVQGETPSKQEADDDKTLPTASKEAMFDIPEPELAIPKSDAGEPDTQEANPSEGNLADLALSMLKRESSLQQGSLASRASSLLMALDLEDTPEQKKPSWLLAAVFGTVSAIFFLAVLVLLFLFA
ncbi:Hypothetical protein PBC10988_7500 [Planctomycetales bacterium 10988]|nr:Hypothetical protein PBC10988_7500 [Planctomycetales bacterium 10988]